MFYSTKKNLSTFIDVYRRLDKLKAHIYNKNSNHSTTTARPQRDHSTTTARPQHDHSATITRLNHSHTTTTARPQRDHSATTARPQLNKKRGFADLKNLSTFIDVYRPLYKIKAGFTLIELLITTSLTVLLLLGVSSLFMTFLLGSAKTNTRKTVKEEGVHALSQMEFLLRNANYIDETVSICTDNMPEITIVSMDGGSTTLSAKQDASDGDGTYYKIASNSAFLTSSSVTIISNALDFDCSGETGNRQVKINFALEKITPDGNISQIFSSTVNMRN